MALDEALEGLSAVVATRPAFAPLLETMRQAAHASPELGARYTVLHYDNLMPAVCIVWSHAQTPRGYFFKRNIIYFHCLEQS